MPVPKKACPACGERVSGKYIRVNYKRPIFPRIEGFISRSRTSTYGGEFVLKSRSRDESRSRLELRVATAS